MDSVREILDILDARGAGPPTIPEVEGRSADEMGYHLWLLWKGGFIEAIDATSISDCAPRMIPTYLTWQAHDFHDLARDDTNWHKAKSWILDRGQALALEAMKLVLPVILKQSLGL
ncbi:MAG: DUF2513 domain-containing protein [Acidobacteria bacterium]|nr:DUF2513 domain-containing protein [Acidobacteriota bacterium]